MASWSFGGTALTTYGKVIRAAYLDIPARRGDDIVIPYSNGEVFTQKYYGGRSIGFELVLSSASATALEASIDALKAKLSLMTQQTLAQTMADTTVRNISATVNELVEMERVVNIVRYALVFKTTSPFYRLSTVIADNTVTVNTSPKAWSVTNPGSVIEYEPTLILTGPLQNTVITNSTNGFVLTYTGTIASPRVVTIQKTSGQWIATTDLGVDVTANVTHSGGAEFMRFNTGANTMSITDATATTGTVKAAFYAPFL